MKKDVIKCDTIGENTKILQQPRLRLLAIRVDENAAILGYPETFEKITLNLSIS